MLHHLLPRAATTTAAWLLLLFLTLGLIPAPAIAPGPDPGIAFWIVNVIFNDTYDGTIGGQSWFSFYAATDSCYNPSLGSDWISFTTLGPRYSLIGWNTINCTDEPIFEFKRRNVSYYEPPEDWKGFEVSEL